MALPCSFSAEDAKTSIEHKGVYVLEDPVVGRRVNEFRDSGFPIKSPLGFEFLAQNSFDREDIRTLFRSILIRPQWGLIKIYSDILSSDYAFRFHNGSDDKTHTLLVQLWGPKTTVVFYDGSQTQNIIEVDEDMSKKWGLLATRRDHMRREGMSENTIKMELGGLALSDSRLDFTILEGYVIIIGFTTQAELKFWAPMELPYYDGFKSKIEELEARGFDINYTWIRPTR